MSWVRVPGGPPKQKTFLAEGLLFWLGFWDETKNGQKSPGEAFLLHTENESQVARARYFVIIDVNDDTRTKLYRRRQRPYEHFPRLAWQ